MDSKNKTKKTQSNATNLYQNITTRKKKPVIKNYPDNTINVAPSDNNSMTSCNATLTKSNSFSLDSTFLSEGDTCHEHPSPDPSNSILSKSMEEISCISITLDLKHQINTLNSELMTTQNELENTICENNELKRTISKLTQEVTVLKTICSNTSIKTHSSSTPKRKRLSITAKDGHGSETPQSLMATPRGCLEFERIKLEKQILSLQKQLSQAYEEITQLRNKIDMLELKISQTPTTDLVQHKLLQPNYTKNPLIKNKKSQDKVCIVSTNKRNKILNIAENIFNNSNYDLCHYLMPHRSIIMLLEDIALKISDYTQNDFWIILLGEDDFNTSKNHQDLVYFIRNTLQKIHDTNIIICSPTVKCASYANVFNWRVEHFNKLLNEDVNSLEYAYLIDSNLNLKYDETMFHKRKGTLNNHGMRTIFNDIYNKITEIKEWNCSNMSHEDAEESGEDDSTNLFFRG